MSGNTTTETPDPIVPAAGVAAEVPQAEDVEYPEGRWVAPSVAHGDAVEQATGALRYHFREHEDVLVAMELVVYYRRGNNRVWLQPDVQVVHRVGRGGRSVFKVWEEGKPPDFVLEVASPSTAGKDAQHKVGEYASLGVREYWRLDPVGELMARPLEGYVARAGGYEPAPALAIEGRTWLRSEVLGLELRGEWRERGTVLVFRDPRTGRSGPARPNGSGRPSSANERPLNNGLGTQSASDRPPNGEQMQRTKECGHWRSGSALSLPTARTPPPKSDPEVPPSWSAMPRFDHRNGHWHCNPPVHGAGHVPLRRRPRRLASRLFRIPDGVRRDRQGAVAH